MQSNKIVLNALVLVSLLIAIEAAYLQSSDLPPRPPGFRQQTVYPGQYVHINYDNLQDEDFKYDTNEMIADKNPVLYGEIPAEDDEMVVRSEELNGEIEDNDGRFRWQ